MDQREVSGQKTPKNETFAPKNSGFQWETIAYFYVPARVSEWAESFAGLEWGLLEDTAAKHLG
jgi:hypothetical protein